MDQALDDIVQERKVNSANRKAVLLLTNVHISEAEFEEEGIVKVTGRVMAQERYILLYPTVIHVDVSNRFFHLILLTPGPQIASLDHSRGPILFEWTAQLALTMLAHILDLRLT